MQAFQNHMRQVAKTAGQDVGKPIIGNVTGYDPGNHTVKVQLRPSGIETGWIPVASSWVGNGWGMFCPPSLGDAVEVQFQEGGQEAGYTCKRFFNDTHRPLPVESGEFWLVHETGSFFKLLNDGKLTVNGQLEIDATAPTINITATGNCNVVAATATVTASAAVTVTAPAISLSAMGQTLRSLVTDVFISLFNSHTHPETGSNTGVPTQQMSAGTHATSTVKGA